MQKKERNRVVSVILADDDFKRMRDKHNIYIYGAKSIANEVYNYLAENQCDIKGFIVSRTLNNPDQLKGLPVRLVYHMLPEKEKICIIVGVLPKFKREVVELLLQLGFCNIVTMKDEYALTLKRRLDEKQKVSCLDEAGYLLEQPKGIEKGHAVIRKKDSPGAVKWRMDLGYFEDARRAVESGAWMNDGLTAEYEQVYGRAGDTLWQEGEHRDFVGCSDSQASKITELADIYAVKCHVDKFASNVVPYPYMRAIQAGAALTEQRLCGCTDNTGDNISDKNRDFSECTAIYWIWKNGQKKEYTGICHYRRYLNLAGEDLLNQFEKGTSLIQTIPCIMYPSNKSFFISALIYEYDWLIMMDMIRKKKPEYYETALALEKGHFYLANNIFIMKTEWFDRMCGFVFDVLLEIDKYYAERRLERQDRYAGYLFEVLYSIFVMHHAREMRISYADMIYLS